MSPWTYDGTTGIIDRKKCRIFALSFSEDNLAMLLARRAAWSGANRKLTTKKTFLRMILFKLFKNKNKNIEEAYGKVYARPVVTQTIGISELAEHLCSHNTGFSAGATQGLLTDMVKCIRELCLQGIAVRIENLAIFSLGIKTKKGADSEEEFSVAKNIEGVKLRARATGSFSSSNLDLNASLRNYDSFVKSAASDTGDDGDTPSGGGNSPSGSDTKGDSSSGGGSSSGSGTTPSGGGSSTGSGGDSEEY